MPHVVFLNDVFVERHVLVLKVTPRKTCEGMRVWGCDLKVCEGHCEVHAVKLMLVWVCFISNMDNWMYMCWNVTLGNWPITYYDNQYIMVTDTDHRIEHLPQMKQVFLSVSFLWFLSALSAAKVSMMTPKMRFWMMITITMKKKVRSKRVRSRNRLSW